MIWSFKVTFRTIVALGLAVITISACSNSPEWINVGNQIASLEKNDPAKIRDIPYRLFDWDTKAGKIEKTTDVVDLKLAIQSGRARGQLVMIAVYSCWAPDVRSGVPTVMCSAQSHGDVYLAGDDQIRSKLLHLAEGKQIGSVVGRIIGSHAGNPVILVL